MELEQVYIQNLVTDLENQLIELDRQKKGEILVKEALNRTIKKINTEFKDGDIEEYNKDTQSIIITRALNLYDATFEDLKSTGNMNLIRNEKLKQEILDYFQFSNRRVYVIRKNAEGFHHFILENFMSTQLSNFNITGMNDRVDQGGELYESINIDIYDNEIQKALNNRLQERLEDIGHIQIVKNVVTNRKWLNEVSIRFMVQLEERTNELIMNLKKELE